MSERVLIAMSGGVDSSVAAARLCAQGFDVVGVTLHLWDYPDDGSVKSRCCAPEDVHDARRVADLLGIPHYAFDRRELFQREVVAPFVESYLEGETPSPCVRCNRGVKIKELFQLADRLSAPRVATGHYARVVQRGSSFELHRGRDHGKDQSYFLHMLGQDALSRLMFPLGESDKPEIRAEALRLNLPGAQKGESQELCFVPTGRYDAFVAERADGRMRPGPILDEQGQKVGEHEGVFRFTLGQRKNLGVALGQRAYVVGVDAKSATVTLGSADSLYSGSAELTEVALAADLSLPLRCEVQVRYRGTPAPAEVRRVGGALQVFFDEPQRAVVPGQFAVFFQGERVLGGGLIRSAQRAPRSELPAQAPESFAWVSRFSCLAFGLLLLAPLGCTVGQGEGEVKSDHLYVSGCWNGPFDLGPSFFGANPDQGESLTIRVQRGDNIEDVSDGLIVLVNDLQQVRMQLNTDIQVGMPPGVSPPGVPIVFNPNPPKVSLSLYLHNTCHQQNGTVYSVAGTIHFASLFSGDLNEGSSENRRTQATFNASFADPRDLALAADDAAKAAVTSTVTGDFDFFFQRGQPSQPFE